LSAILEAVVAVYQALRTAIEYARRILEIMLTVFNTVVQIAQGVIDPAAEMLERGLRMAMPVVIGFLANYAGLGGIGGRIREIVVAVRERVDAAILWLIDRALAAGRWLLDRLRAGVAAIVEWWKTRKRFRLGNVQHTLYFEGEGATARLVIATVPQLLENYYNNTLKPAYATTNPVPLQAIKTAIDAIAILRQKDTMSQADGVALAGHMDTIATNIVLLGGGDIPQSVANWTKFSVSGYAGDLCTGVIANPLSMRAGVNFTGSSPYQTTGIWDKVTERPDTYVRGHILNHNLHGPGRNENLAPITIDFNNQMKSDFENPLKEDILETGKIMYFKVSVSYTNPHPDRKSDPVKNWIDEERHLPTKVTMEAYEVEQSAPSVWTKKAGGVTVKPFNERHSLPRDDRPTGYPVVNLNTATEAELQKIPLIGPVRARAIVQLRNDRLAQTPPVTRFGSYDDLVDARIPRPLIEELRNKGRITQY
jgi:hypothetical protein